MTPSEYSFLENPIFIQFIITSEQIVVSFYFSTYQLLYHFYILPLTHYISALKKFDMSWYQIIVHLNDLMLSLNNLFIYSFTFWCSPIGSYHHQQNECYITLLPPPLPPPQTPKGVYLSFSMLHSILAVVNLLGPTEYRKLPKTTENYRKQPKTNLSQIPKTTPDWFLLMLEYTKEYQSTLT